MNAAEEPRPLETPIAGPGPEITKQALEGIESRTHVVPPARATPRRMAATPLDERRFNRRTSHRHASEVGGILTNDDSIEAEDKWAQSQEAVRTLDSQAEEIKRQLNQIENSRFVRLARVFGLSSPELDLLRLSAAVASIRLSDVSARICKITRDELI